MPPLLSEALSLATLRDQDTNVVQDASMSDLAVEPFTNAFVNEDSQEPITVTVEQVKENTDTNINVTSAQGEEEMVLNNMDGVNDPASVSSISSCANDETRQS
jgi:hypothetical protein